MCRVVDWLGRLGGVWKAAWRCLCFLDAHVRAQVQITFIRGVEDAVRSHDAQCSGSFLNISAIGLFLMQCMEDVLESLSTLRYVRRFPASRTSESWASRRSAWGAFEDCERRRCDAMRCDGAVDDCN